MNNSDTNSLVALTVLDSSALAGVIGGAGKTGGGHGEDFDENGKPVSACLRHAIDDADLILRQDPTFKRLSEADQKARFIALRNSLAAQCEAKKK